MIRDELLQAAQAQKNAAEIRIANISNDTLILNRQIIEAQARVDALHNEWEVLQNQYTAAQIAARAAIEEIQRLTEGIAMAGGRSRRNRKRTLRKRTHRRRTTKF